MEKMTVDRELEADFERAAALDDDSASMEMLNSGIPIHVANDETPEGCVIRIHPDGREEIVRFDRMAAAKVLGG